MDYADYDTAAKTADGGETALFPFARPMRAITPARKQAVVAVVEDGVSIAQELWRICEFLDIAVMRVPSHGDLSSVLRTSAPLAVVCELDGSGQDGCHIMKTVASHDPGLPIMILTGDDPALIGAADAVEEIWQLTEVTKLETLPGMAGLVDFLFHAGRKGNCLRLMPARG
jgi:hypothetical protein